MCFPGNFWLRCASHIKPFSLGILSGMKYARQLQRSMQMWTWIKQGSKMVIYFLFVSAGQCELQPLSVLLEHFSFYVFTLLVMCNIRSRARLQILTFGYTKEFSKMLPKPKTQIILNRNDGMIFSLSRAALNFTHYSNVWTTSTFLRRFAIYFCFPT